MSQSQEPKEKNSINTKGINTIISSYKYPKYKSAYNNSLREAAKKIHSLMARP